MFLLPIGLSKIMKKILIVLIFLFIFAFNVSAQNIEARKVDSINSFICDESKARIDNFEREINNEKDARGYIIIYEGKSGNILPRTGEANSRIDFMKKILEVLRYSPENVVFINGGFRENLTADFWLVPKNAKPPKPAPTLKKIKHRKGKALKLQMGDC